MTAPAGAPGTLHAFALRLFPHDPDSPGSPACPVSPHDPDAHCALIQEYRRVHRCRTRGPDARHQQGMAAAAVLEHHFARPDNRPEDLLDAFHDVAVPSRHNPHLAAAIQRTDPDRARHAGRWLLRNSTHECAARIGLALLSENHHPDDIPLIRTLGLLGDSLAPLVAFALGRRREAVEPLIWLADRSGGWSRVYYVEALCERPSRARHWLLRNACDGDHLNGYFAGTVATLAHLHEAITAADPDEALVDHTGRLLTVMTFAGGMGTGLTGYPPARAVLAAYARHLGRKAPTLDRWMRAAYLGEFLLGCPPEEIGCTVGERDRLIRRFRVILARRSWRDAVRERAAPSDGPHLWHAARVLARMREHDRRWYQDQQVSGVLSAG
ncbi:hypothetical protein [Actinoplanes couchii]|uniref:Uncharacterized protein n=1 Tax=Actinoplanes couchii TaxID=403638 RepID=A0ABQ3X558_9ACTN|nr:hypothetical protein [Actinoplanes couchii]MDR6325995.1 hypothetical protein [Actinoplanes couchii]GID53652.1 hypothetical protein Aco03nite_020560 [Actinoplanes couchii]